MPISTYYSSKHINLGDAINPFLLRKFFHADIELVKYRDAEFFPIGSILGKVTSSRCDFIRRIKGHFQAPAVIWTSGFLTPPASKDVLCRKLQITALRGKLSKMWMEKLLGNKLDVPLGDGGLLMPRLLEKRPEKQIALGIIPHYSEVRSPRMQRLLQKFPQAVAISPEVFDSDRVEERLLELLQKIASCETILSSSLHGLIAADAFGIPCRHIVDTELHGGLFKYHDYRSAFGLEDAPIAIDDLCHGSVALTDMFREHQVSSDQVAEVAAKITAVFPRFAE